MKKLIVGSVCLALFAACASYGFAARKVSKNETPASGDSSQMKTVSANTLSNTTVFINFEKDTERYGVWQKDIKDPSQGIKYEIVSPGVDDRGKCVKLTYDVDSPNEAYCGFWMTINADLREYKKLVFWAKGDKSAGFTSTIKTELKNNMESSAPYTDKITSRWTKIEIPLEDFNTITDWSKMIQFVVTFDSQVTQKTGVIYLDNIGFEK
ncbi:MAG: carbohydrate binding domain-containing protein [Elusimicrobiota bacterium]